MGDGRWDRREMGDGTEGILKGKKRYTLLVIVQVYKEGSKNKCNYKQIEDSGKH
jgi:hypothetical protein